MTNPARSISASVQSNRSILVLLVFLLGAAAAACGGDAREPGMPSQPGDAGPGADASPPPDALPPPETTITEPEAGATTGATVSVEFSAPGTGIHFACRLDAEPASACSSPRVYTSLTDGLHTVFVRAITADNVAGREASRSFTVDASLPIVTVSGPPARGSVTSMTGTELTFSADKPDSTITCRIDGAGPAPCTSPLELSGLTDGVHTAVFQATSGTHVGPQVAWSWTVDTVAPTALITGPVTVGHPVRERLPTLTGTTEPGLAVSIHITADCGLPVAGTAAATSDGTFAVKIVATVPASADGLTTYYVHAIDLGGNASCSGPFSYFTDNTPPAVAVQSPNTAGTPSKERRPTLTGTAEAAATVRIFRGASCSGPSTAPVTSGGTWTIAIDAATEAVADGTTAYSAQATDAAGNTGCAGVSYFTDNTPPAVTVQSLNTASTPSRERRPTLTGTAETAAAVRIFRGTGCTGPSTAPVTSTGTWTIAIDAATEAAPDGMTAYSAQATDAAGNAGCAGVSYFTDTTPPAVAITAPVTDAQHGRRPRRPVLSGTAETGATVQVFRGDACTGPGTATTRAAGGTWTIATDPTTDTPADGPTIYTARATDALGNTACSPTFTYFSDNTPPETTITSPAVPTFTNRNQRTFTFSSNEPAAHFECANNTGTFVPCTSPFDENNAPNFFDLGPVNFQVRAIDPAGNVDASPAAFTWTTTEDPMIQYAFDGDGANTGVLALDGAPDYTGSVQNADFVPGRFGRPWRSGRHRRASSSPRPRSRTCFVERSASTSRSGSVRTPCARASATPLCTTTGCFASFTPPMATSSRYACPPSARPSRTASAAGISCGSSGPSWRSSSTSIPPWSRRSWTPVSRTAGPPTSRSAAARTSWSMICVCSTWNCFSVGTPWETTAARSLRRTIATAIAGPDRR